MECLWWWQKYYPPDFDPSKIPRVRQAKNRQFTVRLMAPFNMKWVLLLLLAGKAQRKVSNSVPLLKLNLTLSNFISGARRAENISTKVKNSTLVKKMSKMKITWAFASIASISRWLLHYLTPKEMMNSNLFLFEFSALDVCLRFPSKLTPKAQITLLRRAPLVILWL